MGAPEGGLKQCGRGWGQNRTPGGSACVSKAMFPFTTGSPPWRRLTTTHNIVVPDASFICQPVNLSEIEPEKARGKYRNHA